MALTLAGIPHKVVNISEIDKHALASYQAIYGDCPNMGDITKIEVLPSCDLVTYSFPCQDLSLAGKRKGMGEGTRSGLVWEVVRLLGSADPRPEWLLMENVPQVLTAPEWPTLVAKLEAMGYRNKWAKLDSCCFGSAQKRIRAFMLSRLGQEPPDLPLGTGEPPRCIRDVMEPERSERFVKRIPLDRIKWREPPRGEANPIRVFGCMDDDGNLDQGVLPSKTFRNRRVYEAEGLAPACVVKGDSRISVVGVPGTSTPVAEVEGVVYYPERVLYSMDGSSPTVCTDHKNNRIKVVADIDDPNSWKMWKEVLDPEGLSPCVPKRINSKGTSLKVAGEAGESTPIAEDTGQTFYSRRMLYSADGSSPTVRTYHGDNYSIKVVADIDRPGVFDQCNRIYSPDDSAPAIPAATNTGNRSIKVVADWQREGRLDLANRLYDCDGASPTVVAHGGGNRDIKVVAEDTSKAYGSSAKILSPASSSPTLRSQVHGLQNQPKVAYLTDGDDLVVWVLTPRECWRLMGFPDWAYDRASAVSSETQLYNQAGNSIVVPVLESIFKAMAQPPKAVQSTLGDWLSPDKETVSKE